MNKIDFRIPGTKIPNLPKNIEFKAAYWRDFKHADYYYDRMNQKKLVSYGYIKHNNEDCILVEEKKYSGNNHWIFRESDLIKLTEEMNKQNNLPKYWVVKNTNNDDFKVVMDYLNDTYGSSYKLGNHKYYGYDGNNVMKHKTACCFTMDAFVNNPTLLTLEEFKKAINIEEEFVLPEKWCINVSGNSDSNLEIYQWRKKGWISTVGYIDYNKNWWLTSNDCTEITFEQFKKYVLKMEDSKKIIGYKSPIRFGHGVEVGMIFERIPNIPDYYRPKDKHDDMFNRLPQEIVENWEPIYEEEVKTINMGSFNLTVKDKKVFHKNEDITNFVKDMYEINLVLHRSINHNNTSGCVRNSIYKINIKNVIFDQTGCERNETKLSDWLKVYDMIK